MRHRWTICLSILEACFLYFNEIIRQVIILGSHLLAYRVATKPEKSENYVFNQGKMKRKERFFKKSGKFSVSCCFISEQ